ncbi:YitT family protein [Bacillaceae bacterium SIJ1]|uniref:YitT family protein n=1 Tax=Litoribacterium kuwaitense TaxID=1398745 RepID=UPI0013EB1CAB|nr:YitT family protein [Litoribacterium kuwaitense]NGP44465.1 YitT family protein [Litoribacterium kuwaitense]
MEHKKKRTLYKLLRRLILVPIGAMIIAIGLEIFLVPNEIIDGGITGISIMLSTLTPGDLGLYLFLLNLPFVFLGYSQMGKTFALTTLFGISCLAVSTYMLHSVPAFVDDTLLAAVFGGLLVGFGVGLVIRNGGTTDGTEVLAVLFTKKTSFSVGEIIMFMNIFIISAAGFVFNWESALYSMIAYFIAYKMIDATVAGMDGSKSVWIISENAHTIGEAINEQLGRGVTYLYGEGAFSGDNKKVIFTVITRVEESKLHNLVEEIDEDAFLAVGNIQDVKGGQFKTKDIH